MLTQRGSGCFTLYFKTSVVACTLDVGPRTLLFAEKENDMSLKPAEMENMFVMYTRVESRVQLMHKIISVFVDIATVMEGILPVNLF